MFSFGHLDFAFLFESFLIVCVCVCVCSCMCILFIEYLKLMAIKSWKGFYYDDIYLHCQSA